MSAVVNRRRRVEGARTVGGGRAIEYWRLLWFLGRKQRKSEEKLKKVKYVVPSAVNKCRCPIVPTLPFI